jgi:hypothetical protein
VVGNLADNSISGTPFIAGQQSLLRVIKAGIIAIQLHRDIYHVQSLGFTSRERFRQQLVLTRRAHTFSLPLIVAGRVEYVEPRLAVGIGIGMIEPAAW